MFKKMFWGQFSKRSLITFFIIIILFYITILRVAVISISNYGEVQKNIGSIKIKIGSVRGTVFDKNKYPITNSQKKIIAAVSPTPRAITAISHVLTKGDLDSVLEILKSGKPAICEVPEWIECDGVICTEIFENNDNTPAIHTIGYTDNENKGLSGIQKAYDDILMPEKDIFVRYACDGKGKILNGIKPEIINQTSPYTNGVVTTIDINIQKITEEVSENLGLGAVIVADAKTAKIRAITSRPNFTSDTVQNLLNDESTPLYNRALGAYNVGSVFKLCVAAAGVENNLKNFNCNCKGSLEIIDRTFHCHERLGHKFINLETAIAKSCNIYFFELGFKIGNENITRFANILNFGKAIKICENIYTASGNLPSKEKLENNAHLANFSIGQGSFSASPISMLPLYCAIANGGEYYIPSIVESTIEDGRETKYNIGHPTKAFTHDTANILKNALSLVIEQGTGTLAKPKTVTAGGKTATAQTGKFENNIEINSSWFCGFFPLESPEYVVIIFSEDTKKQNKSCAEIFAQIADKITALQ